MIPERDMATAKRFDNGEMVQGYIFVETFINEYDEPEELYYIQTDFAKWHNHFKELTTEAFKVDPTTIQPVAVKVKDIGRSGCMFIGDCPNCSHQVENEQNYCEDCGQKLDWS